MDKALNAESILISCDNTLGANFCDIDDGLALCYLLACPELLNIVGILTSYGNAKLSTVSKYTRSLLEALGRNQVSVFEGASSPRSDKQSAAEFLVQCAKEQQGELTILSLAPLTNIYEATRIDPLFFSRIKRIICMGGRRKHNWVGWRRLKELNFSLDPVAAEAVLNAPCDVLLFDTDVCLQVRFGNREVKQIVNRLSGHPNWIASSIKKWLRLNQLGYFVNSFCPWDLVAACYLLQPELFLSQNVSNSSNCHDLAQGNIKLSHANFDCGLKLVTHIVEPQAVFTNLLDALDKFREQSIQQSSALCHPSPV